MYVWSKYIKPMHVNDFGKNETVSRMDRGCRYKSTGRDAQHDLATCIGSLNLQP